MLEESLKTRIRDAYNAIIAAKGLSPRWGQRQMIAEIANTLARIPSAGAAEPEQPAICVIEAGTGTGKTIAYAVAAIPLAQALGKRLVVATATVALQEQFVQKDLPDIQEGTGLEFSYVLAKGRRRYVCLAKLDRQLESRSDQTLSLALYPDEQEQPDAAEAAPYHDAMIDALGRGTWDGDRDNWPDTVPDPVWQGVSTDHHQCTGRRCPHIGQCSFFRARDALQTADIVVTNHDLVLSDLALGGGAILPPPDEAIYIFDEGHHLPDKALNHFSSFCRLHSTRAWLADSERSLSQGRDTLEAATGLARQLAELPTRCEELALAIEQVEQDVATLFEDDDSPGDRTLRFPHGQVPQALRDASARLAAGFAKLASGLSRIEARLEDALEDGDNADDREALETWHMTLGGMLARTESTLALWEDFAADPGGENPPRARWINFLNSGNQFGFDLIASPVLARDILTEVLWTRAAGVVVTSATLTALGRFDRFRLHSGAPENAAFKAVASPFDYARATLHVPAMKSDPSNPEAHTQELIELLPQLLQRDQGALVLFSSRRQMLDVQAGVKDALGDLLLMQGELSKQEILKRHRERIDAGLGSVIFGLASFAEGVDLPGHYCEHVLIAKIPFAVPDSPLEAALAEWVEAEGRNAFMEISVPDAALRLVQASGRLLRSEEDKGRVTLLDRRVVTRRYGRAILDSLPAFQRVID